MKIVTVVGARPQFIKAYLVSRELKKKRIREVIVHTGQHYDYNMSGVFLAQFNMPPDYNLGVGSATGINQVARMLLGLEKVLDKEKPDLVLVYGDTNSTLAGAISATRMNIKLAHIEAGLRSYNKSMPEEINRVVTDKIADLLFCPTSVAAGNLKKEGIQKNVYLVGDLMYDSLKLVVKENKILKSNQPEYILATLHRCGNTDIMSRLKEIFKSFCLLNEKIIIPLHPRTRKVMREAGIKIGPNLKIIDPVSYIKMLELEMNAKLIITDSGGVQKEAFILGKPCVTLREETEWVETVKAGMNILAGCSADKIVKAVKKMSQKKKSCIDAAGFYGTGDSYRKIVAILLAYLKREE